MTTVAEIVHQQINCKHEEWSDDEDCECGSEMSCCLECHIMMFEINEQKLEALRQKEYTGLKDEIMEWKNATGLVDSSGDPDGITPDDLRAEIKRLDTASIVLESMERRIEKLEEALGLIARNGGEWTRGWIVDRAKEALGGGS